jgi:hypothetical protein
MPPAATPSAVGYTSATEEPFEFPNVWYQPALATQQSDPVFAAATSPQYVPVARPFNDVTYDHGGGYPSFGLYDVGSLHPGLLRRHTVHESHPMMAIGYGYCAQYETELAASFPHIMPAPHDLPTSFENGLMSPRQTTTSSSRTSITSLHTGPPPYSPIASGTYQNLTNFNTESPPISASSLLPVPYPYSPTTSDGSPTQKQITMPLQGEQPNKHGPDPIPDPIPCNALGCKAKFTGDYQKGNLKRHVKSCHPELVAQNGEIQRDLSKLKCSRCSFVFKRSDARKKHEYRAHRVGPRPSNKYRPTAL